MFSPAWCEIPRFEVGVFRQNKGTTAIARGYRHSPSNNQQPNQTTCTAEAGANESLMMPPEMGKAPIFHRLPLLLPLNALFANRLKQPVLPHSLRVLHPSPLR